MADIPAKSPGGARLSMAYQIHRAKLGETARMPNALRILAERLRDGTLDDAEIYFLASALEQIADAEKPAKEAAKAFCLVRKQGRAPHASKIDSEIDRAFRVRDIRVNDPSITMEVAFSMVAEEQDLKQDAEIRKAYYKYLDVLWLGSE